RRAAGRLRARRRARTPAQRAAALAAESDALTCRIEQADVRTLPTPVGEWLAQEGAPVPAGYAAVRARFSRLRGELREAAAWAREGLRGAVGDAPCRTELALAAAQSGDAATAQEAVAGCPDLDEPSAWLIAARGDVDGALAAIGDAADGMAQKYGDGSDRMAASSDRTGSATAEIAGTDSVFALYDAVRLGAPEKVAERLPADGVFAL